MLRLAFHIEQGDHVEVETATDYERTKDNVHEDGAPGLSGQRVLPSMRIT